MMTGQRKDRFYGEMEWRGFIHTATPGVRQHLAAASVTGYIGFDPTAPSLHVGSLLPIMGLVHLQRGGHRPIAIAGGGTGMIGDPSGKSQERNLLSAVEIAANLEGIRRQLGHYLDFSDRKNGALIVDNAEWLAPLRLMDFLRDVGKHFSVNEMLAKDSVRSRLEKEQGISFTEFSYSVLQSYDYLALSDRYGCTLQMGGSDQWGNIVSGIDLVRRTRSREVHGMVYPLITTSAGAKFGKTEAGTVWLDAGKTSPYAFYQFWLNTDDRDVVRYLKFFTLLPEAEIAGLEAELERAPSERIAHRRLAAEVTGMLHGEDALAQAVRASGIFFGAEIRDVPPDTLLEIFSDVPSTEFPKDRVAGGELAVPELLVSSGLVSSKGEARRSIEGGGIYVNNVRVKSPTEKIPPAACLHGRFIVLRKGGRNYHLVRLT
jgi:tyrosyl-tRNA synthetase